MFRGDDVTEHSPLQFHQELEIGAVSQGRVRIYDHLGEVVVGPGQGVLIPPGLAHRVSVVEGPVSFLALYIALSLAGELGGVSEWERRVRPNSISQSSFAQLELALLGGCQQRARSALGEALGGSRGSPPISADAAPLRADLEEARRYMLRERCRTPTLDELAEVAGLSRYHFGRQFKRTYGLPPLAYHRQLRLLRAQEGLAAGESLQDLALELGFSDSAHLGRVFRKTFKVSPGMYRSALSQARS